MTKRFLFGMSVILSTAIAGPVYAQAVTQQRYLSNVGLGIESASSRPREISIASRGTDDAMPSSPSVRPWSAGNETATMPWSAPVGHHQPSAADVHELAYAAQPILDHEQSNVDRIVRSVCRGC